MEAVSNAVNNSGWKLSHNSKQNGIVKPGDEVNFADGKGTTVNITGDKDKRVVKINTNIEAGNNITIDEDKDTGKLTINASPTASDYSFNINSNITTFEPKTTVPPAGGKPTTTLEKTSKEKNVSTIGNKQTLTFANGDMMRLDVTSEGDKTTVKYTPVVQGVTANESGKVETSGANSAYSQNGLTTAQGVATAINQSGWNIGSNDKTKVDLINPGEQVNFINGNATTSTVTKDGDNVNVKYDITTADGLEISNNAVKVKTDGNTLTVSNNGIKANTGDVESDSGNNKGKVKVKNGDDGKLATVDNVVKAVNSAK
nr:hypothetical protein [uncultured Haemophilus sp.]